MKAWKVLLFLVVGTLTVTVAAAGVSPGQGGQPAGHAGKKAPAKPAHPDPTVSQYAGEFICGSVPLGIPPGAGVLGPGDYRSEISIHNANNFPVFIQKKVAALPPPEG